MADESELSDAELDASFDRLRAAYAAQSRVLSKRSKQSGIVLAVNLAVASIFLKGMPLHEFFRPWGIIVLGLFTLSFSVAVINFAFVVINWSTRRELERIP